MAAAAVCFANRTATFLIVEHPRTLTIFNQYQQRLSAQEAAALASFTPFTILSASDVLGDGFTSCMKVEAHGSVFYLEKDEDGALLGATHGGVQKLLRDVSVIGDTIEIIKSRRLTLTDPQQVQTSFLDEGTRVARVFRNGGLTYVRILGVKESYGWIDFEPAVQGKDWSHVKLVGVSLADQVVKLLPRIQLKVNEVNAKLAQLFDHFNKSSSKKLQPPEWRIQRLGTTVRCLLASNMPPGKFSETSQALGKSFEGLVLGTELRVVSKPGLIEVRK